MRALFYAHSGHYVGLLSEAELGFYLLDQVWIKIKLVSI